MNRAGISEKVNMLKINWEEVIKEYIKGKNTKELAYKYGCSSPTVVWNLKKRNIPRRYKFLFSKGHFVNDKTKKKISDKLKITMLEKWQNSEYRKHMSEVHRGQISPMQGKHHTNKTKLKISKRLQGKYVGKLSGNWKGGKVKHSGGYTQIINGINSGYILEHRLIIRNRLGIELSRHIVVHHINKIKNDNRLSNLMVFRGNQNHLKFERGYKVNPQNIIFDGGHIGD